MLLPWWEVGAEQGASGPQLARSELNYINIGDMA